MSAKGSILEVFASKNESEVLESSFKEQHPGALCFCPDTNSIVFSGKKLTVGDKQSSYNRWVEEKRVLKTDEIVEVGDATINDTDVIKASSNDKLVWATDKKSVYLKHNGAYYRYWDEYKVLGVTFIFGSDYCNTMTASGCLAIVGGKDLYLIGKLNQPLCLASSDTSSLIASLQNTINNLIKRIETLEKLNNINNNYVKNGVLHTSATVRDGIMIISGVVNNGVLKL